MLILTASGLNVLHIKKVHGVKHYCHIVHSLTPMTYRVFGIDYFDSVLVANEIQRDFVRDVESAHNTKPKHIAVTGYPFIDESYLIQSNLKQNKIDSITLPNQSTQTILISPSWGKESLLSKFGLALLMPLAKTSFHIIIRPHPQSLIGKEESQNIAFLQAQLQPYDNVIWDIGTPNVYAFSLCDMMISDFSSIIFDFVCLEQKPVLTIDFVFDTTGYDVDDIPKGRFWTIHALNKIGKRIKSEDFPHIKDIIQDTLQSHKLDKDISDIKQSLWRFPHQGGAKTTEAILRIHKDIITAELKQYAPLIERLSQIDSALASIEKRDNRGQE